MADVGHTYVKAIAYKPDFSRSTEVELLVDMGSTYTWIPQEKLRELGVKPITARRFATIDGRRLERSIGEALIELMGERATSIVVFAQENDAKVLGVHALEGLGLEVDPNTKTIRKTEALLAI